MPKLFKVDHGNWFSVINEKALYNIYARQINHKEYPDFECWYTDMERSGLITEVLT